MEEDFDLFRTLKTISLDLIAFDLMESEDGGQERYIDFENSATGRWIKLDRISDLNDGFKSIIKLAIYIGFEHPGIKSFDSLTEAFNQVDNLMDIEEVDLFSSEAIEYLNDCAYESDPGWEIALGVDWLYMSSLYTDESDIWSEDRELKPPAPAVTPRALRAWMSQ